MIENRPPETQQELFREFSREPKKPERFPGIQKAHKPILVSTSVEHVLLGAILLILAGCFVFFLGVLRGKSLAGVSGVSAAPPVAQRPAGPLPVRMQTVRVAAPETASAPPAVSQTPQPARATEARRDSGKPYTIQLVTYKKRDLAEKEVAALRRSGFYSAVIPSGDYYQVCVGQYAGMDDAKKDLKLFGSRYKDRFLRRR